MDRVWTNFGLGQTLDKAKMLQLGGHILDKIWTWTNNGQSLDFVLLAIQWTDSGQCVDVDTLWTNTGLGQSLDKAWTWTVSIVHRPWPSAHPAPTQ